MNAKQQRLYNKFVEPISKDCEPEMELLVNECNNKLLQLIKKGYTENMLDNYLD